MTHRMMRLTRRERELCFFIFDAIFPISGSALPAHKRDPESAFFAAIEEATSPSFLIAFRAALRLIENLPRVVPGYRARFSELSAERRLAFIEELGESDRYMIRQALELMKLFAGLSYFDAAEARARFLRPGPSAEPGA